MYLYKFVHNLGLSYIKFGLMTFDIVLLIKTHSTFGTVCTLITFSFCNSSPVVRAPFSVLDIFLFKLNSHVCKCNLLKCSYFFIILTFNDKFKLLNGDEP